MMNLLNCLQSEPISVLGEFTWGSNASFLVEIDCAEGKIEAVYKPVGGEQPLWDFPAKSLAGRERAAYLLSEALGWALVPPTVFREDGPAGAGSLQWRVAHDVQAHYFTFTEELRQSLRPTVLFDLLANNADRKGGHILLGEEGRFWLIDQGVCFHAEPKLRTVVWDFAGEVIPLELLADLKRLSAHFGKLQSELSAMITKNEIAALEQRLVRLIEENHFPHPSDDVRALPFPLV